MIKGKVLGIKFDTGRKDHKANVIHYEIPNRQIEK